MRQVKVEAEDAVSGIVVGIDDSEGARAALRWALDEGLTHRCRRFGRPCVAPAAGVDR